MLVTACTHNQGEIHSTAFNNSDSTGGGRNGGCGGASILQMLQSVGAPCHLTAHQWTCSETMTAFLTGCKYSLLGRKCRVLIVTESQLAGPTCRVQQVPLLMEKEGRQSDSRQQTSACTHLVLLPARHHTPGPVGVQSLRTALPA